MTRASRTRSSRQRLSGERSSARSSTLSCGERELSARRAPLATAYGAEAARIAAAPVCAHVHRPNVWPWPPRDGRQRRMPGSGVYNKFAPPEGHFKCAGCEQPLYSAAAKFDSGCGWPAFDKIVSGAVVTQTECARAPRTSQPVGRFGLTAARPCDSNTLGMRRVEIMCSACGGHLGHVYAPPRRQPRPPLAARPPLTCPTRAALRARGSRRRWSATASTRRRSRSTSCRSPTDSPRRRCADTPSRCPAARGVAMRRRAVLAWW